jgi:hypothetical protein
MLIDAATGGRGLAVRARTALFSLDEISTVKR